MNAIQSLQNKEPTPSVDSHALTARVDALSGPNSQLRRIASLALLSAGLALPAEAQNNPFSTIDFSQLPKLSPVTLAAASSGTVIPTNSMYFPGTLVTQDTVTRGNIAQFALQLSVGETPLLVQGSPPQTTNSAIRVAGFQGGQLIALTEFDLKTGKIFSFDPNTGATNTSSHYPISSSPSPFLSDLAVLRLLAETADPRSATNNINPYFNSVIQKQLELAAPKLTIRYSPSSIGIDVSPVFSGIKYAAQHSYDVGGVYHQFNLSGDDPNFSVTNAGPNSVQLNFLRFPFDQSGFYRVKLGQ